MTDPTKVTAPTNAKPKSCVDVNCDCNTMWSFAQQFSTMRLCVHEGKLKGVLLKDYNVRARRIAATYARFYLELEDGGNLEKKGRYYWMALGAFASKTVACALESFQVRAMTDALFVKNVWDGLGKGNFWLFCDISGWHWYYNNYQKSFAECLNSRDATKYNKEVRSQISALPWSKQALPTIKNMNVSSEIKAGFEYVKKFEAESDLEKKRAHQFNHLMEIAKHEQGVILQPLIYDDECFSNIVASQRWLSWISPELELVFSSSCSTSDPKLKSIAPKETILENFKSRLTWIKQAAYKFHYLMIQQPDYMHEQLTTIAGWVDVQDAESSTERMNRMINVHPGII